MKVVLESFERTEHIESGALKQILARDFKNRFLEIIKAIEPEDLYQLFDIYVEKHNEEYSYLRAAILVANPKDPKGKKEVTPENNKFHIGIGHNIHSK